VIGINSESLTTFIGISTLTNNFQNYLYLKESKRLMNPIRSLYIYKQKRMDLAENREIVRHPVAQN